MGSKLPGQPMFIDAHAHLDAYDGLGPTALYEALEEIARHRIFTISNSMDLPSYNRNLTIAARSPWVLPAFGIHPWNAHHYLDRRDALAEPMTRSLIFGEIGLDHFFVKERSRYPAQKEVFELFLAAARDQDKIFIIHTKGAERDALEILDGYALPRVIIHWYSGPLDVFRDMIERGFYFTVGGEVGQSEKIREIARMIPSDRLLTETDNPGGPESYLGRPGTPALLLDIVRSLADVRKAPVEELVLAIRSNLANLFHGDGRLPGLGNGKGS